MYLISVHDHSKNLRSCRLLDSFISMTQIAALPCKFSINELSSQKCKKYVAKRKLYPISLVYEKMNPANGIISKNVATTPN